MAITQNLGITKLNPGQSGAHALTNEAFDSLDKAIAGVLSLDLTGLTSLSLTGAQSTNQIIMVTDTTAACVLIMQDKPKTWTIVNDGSHTVTIRANSQVGGPTLAAGVMGIFVCLGNEVRKVV